MTVELTRHTKAELNAQLPSPLTAAQLKKKCYADLVSMVNAVFPTDTVLDNSEYLTPTRQTAPKMRKAAEDRVLVQPATDAAAIRSIRAGTKRHLMAVALARGTTLEQLAEITGWSRSVVSAAIYTDFKAAGLGIERKAGKLHLILPTGVNEIPVRTSAA